jgi:drug/metabolite transporter (DMT)-like permease
MIIFGLYDFDDDDCWRSAMLKKKSHRRILAFSLIVLGAVLMFLAPEVVVGVVMMIAGVLVEMIGITLEHRRTD